MRPFVFEFYTESGNDLESTNFEGHVNFDLCRESPASIATGFGLDDQGIGIGVSKNKEFFSHLHDVLTSCGSCPVGIGSCSPRDKTVMA